MLGALAWTLFPKNQRHFGHNRVLTASNYKLAGFLYSDSPNSFREPLLECKQSKDTSNNRSTFEPRFVVDEYRNNSARLLCLLSSGLYYCGVCSSSEPSLYQEPARRTINWKQICCHFFLLLYQPFETLCWTVTQNVANSTTIFPGRGFRPCWRSPSISAERGNFLINACDPLLKTALENAIRHSTTLSKCW